MKPEHPVSFRNDGTADGVDGIAATIARLQEENEALRRLAASLSAQLNTARRLSTWDSQTPSH
jgi:hypothetical protein